MAIRHPVTGVALNEISIERRTISEGPETETVRLLAREGYKDHTIAAMLGTHPWEIHKITGGGPRRMPSGANLTDGHGDPDQPPLL